ncbi:MAG: CYTH domain-containing protein, partial [Pirellulaceae bacterium]|nr:CYTH domain-containing protein [Pirellulaceae bacterium]
LVVLGFVPLPEVKKCRETFALSASSLAAANSHAREGVPLVFDVHVTLDQVEQLGNFAEIEIIVTSEGELQRAAAQISVVAERLNLASVQPRSYLSLLLTKLELE